MLLESSLDLLVRNGSRSLALRHHDDEHLSFRFAGLISICLVLRDQIPTHPTTAIIDIPDNDVLPPAALKHRKTSFSADNRLPSFNSKRIRFF
jgi:hypothetical protein